jgi:hypothetical protein
MKRVGILALVATAAIGAAPVNGMAQVTEEDVLGVVDALFDAMRAADSAAVRRLFHPELETLGSSGVREGLPIVRYGTVEGFIGSVGDHEPGALDERIGEPWIRVDDNLVTVFTPYEFYYKGNLSHCGVNVFHIARSEAEWLIVGLIDTRRREGCEEWLQ